MTDNESMKERLINTLGESTALELMRIWGGSRLYVPANMRTDCAIALRIGIYNAKALLEEFGPGYIEMPSYSRHIIIERDKKIRQQASHVPRTELARIYGLTERRIRTILAEK